MTRTTTRETTKTTAKRTWTIGRMGATMVITKHVGPQLKRGGSGGRGRGG